MAHKTDVKIDAYLADHLAALSRISGKRNIDGVLAQAIAVTADSLEKIAQGYTARILTQTMSRDSLGYPIEPDFLYIDLKHRAPDPHPALHVLHYDEKTAAHLQTIRRFLGAESNNDAVHFSALFAQTVADELQKPTGIRRLAFVAVNENNSERYYGYTTRTPYDKGLRNNFNRAVHNICFWLIGPGDPERNNDGRNGPPPPPPMI
ncbi:MAG: hypothetical protein HYU57_04620 [Micavibrio aeruginosavorus]|nr:hypothetical protein [Micavibrio aeruginosavorus]